jgi:hypothetical protein
MPKIFDCEIEDLREATQEDIDALARMAQCYGHLRMIMRKFAEPSTVVEQERIIKALREAMPI